MRSKVKARSEEKAPPRAVSIAEGGEDSSDDDKEKDIANGIRMNIATRAAVSKAAATAAVAIAATSSAPDDRLSASEPPRASISSNLQELLSTEEEKNRAKEIEATVAMEKENKAAIRQQNIRYMNLRTVADEGHKLCVDDHDIIVWLGDLNYRMVESIADEDVYSYIDADMQLELAESCDQLTLERDAGRAFQDFHEGLLSFPPTYKYIPGTDSFDRRPEKKNRCPAWCDRVLWRTRTEKNTTLILHQSCTRTGAGREGSTGTTTPNSQDKDKDGDNKDLNADEESAFYQEAEIGQGFSSTRMGLTSAAGKDSFAEETKAIRENIFSDYSSNGLGNPESTTAQLMLYNYVRSFRLSDHKPVTAKINIRVRRVDWAAREKLLLEVARKDAEKESNYEMKELMYGSGTALVQAEPKSLLLFSNNQEFTQAPLKFQNTSNRDLFLHVNHTTTFPSWLRATCTIKDNTIDEGGNESEVSIIREYTRELYDAQLGRIPVPKGSSVQLWVTTNNVEGMMTYAHATMDDTPLCKPLEEDFNEVSFVLSVTMHTQAYTDSNNTNNSNENSADKSKVGSTMFIPVVLVLRSEPSENDKTQTGQVDTLSLLNKLKRMI